MRKYQQLDLVTQGMIMNLPYANPNHPVSGFAIMYRYLAQYGIPVIYGRNPTDESEFVQLWNRVFLISGVDGSLLLQNDYEGEDYPQLSRSIHDMVRAVDNRGYSF